MNESMANIILQKTIENGEQLATVIEKVVNIDEKVDEHGLALIRMESKQNQDYSQFIRKEEELRASGLSLESRVKGLEDHIKLRQAGKREFFGKISETVWVWLQKFGWLIFIGILVAVLGFEKVRQLLDLIK